MIVAITGTPGTGKTSLSEALRSKGYRTIDVGEFARDRKLYSSIDERRGSLEVDPQELDEALQGELPDGTVFLVGHLSHLLTVDTIIVLRCRPSILSQRLSGRKWKEEKIKENVEAEALDVILIEALDGEAEVFEIDTTTLGIEEAAKAVEDILAGEKKKYAVGHVDWSGEVLDWF